MSPVHRLSFLAAVFMSIAAATFQTVANAADSSRPNIILIMADDIGIEGLGCYGGESYKTPRLDQMAAKGLHFTHAYSQPLCTPTRVQIMTGKYNHRNWLYFGCLDPREKTFGHYFSEAGYRTAIVGKWQLTSYDPPDYPGAEKRRNKGTHPKDAGFHEYILYHAEQTEDKGSRYADPTVIENGELKTFPGGYGEDVSIDYLKGFLRRNRDEPFFVYYPMALPHWPMVPTPDSPEWPSSDRRHEEDVAYAVDMVEYMDKTVGRVIDAVEAHGLSDNTLILFYSDNGTDRKVTSILNGKEILGGKGETRDAGVHVPLIAYWPGKIAPGGICEDLVDASDFIPTLAEIAGIIPKPDWQLDGQSFAPQLFGKTHPNPREWVFYWYDPRPGWDKDKFSRHIFAQDKQYKLYRDGRFYDISSDPNEQGAIADSTLSDQQRAAREKLSAAIESTLKPRR